MLCVLSIKSAVRATNVEIRILFPGCVLKSVLSVELCIIYKTAQRPHHFCAPLLDFLNSLNYGMSSLIIQYTLLEFYSFQFQ
jgi:hypothetical protein